MKRFTALTMILILGGTILTGCNSTGATTAATTVATTDTSMAVTEAASSETSASSVQETEPAVTAHTVEVADQSVTSFTDDSGNEYKKIIPKLIVDGKDADSINAELSDYINLNHHLEKVEYSDGEATRYYVDGETTRYAWGVSGDIVSIIIISSETFTDGVRYEVFNYNVDTLQAADNDEVIKSFGMAGDEFNNKVADAYRAWWDSETWLKEDMAALDKSIGAISSGNVTPCVLPGGDPGALGLVYMPQSSQFSEVTRCFNLNSLERVNFSN